MRDAGLPKAAAPQQVCAPVPFWCLAGSRHVEIFSALPRTILLFAVGCSSQHDRRTTEMNSIPGYFPAGQQARRLRRLIEDERREHYFKSDGDLRGYHLQEGNPQPKTVVRQRPDVARPHSSPERG